MKVNNKWLCGTLIAAAAVFCGQAHAQQCNTGSCGTGQSCAGGGDCGPAPHTPCPEVGPSSDCIGAVGPNGQRYLRPRDTVRLAAQDHFAPQPLYTYGPAGLDATRFDYWNRNTAAPRYSWHGNHSYWRYGQPTALVVPPTASFQTEYNWGVGQTRSMPIYHQFNGQAGVGGVAAGGGVAGLFRPAPYWPNSTSQFGVYPVRGPW